jgi:hypothetical protein
MDSILQKIPSSQRAQYSRVQAQIRSSYHTALALRRASEFHAHLSSTRPGQSLTPGARADPHSKLARNERSERLTKLISVWAVGSVPGTKPFFDGLFTALRLQSLPEYLGGAGGFRMEWEIDDAVFRESAYVILISVQITSAWCHLLRRILVCFDCGACSGVVLGYASRRRFKYPSSARLCPLSRDGSHLIPLSLGELGSRPSSVSVV